MSIQLNFKCNESWEQMPDSRTGKFCDKCTRNIYDLTGKSEAEIKQLYVRNNGKLCGRIRNTQLNTLGIHTKEKYALAQFCLALFLVFGSMLFNSCEAMAQHKLGEVVLQNIKECTIKGKVTDKDTGEPLFGVNIFYEQGGYKVGAVTDFDGKYELKINKNEIKTDSISIRFIYIGYEKMQVTNINMNKEIIVVDAALKENVESLEVGFIIIEDFPLIDKDPNAQRSTTIDVNEIKHSPY